MNWIYLIPATFCLFMGFMILFYGFIVGKKVFGVFVLTAFVLFFFHNYLSENFLLKELEPIIFFLTAIIGLMLAVCFSLSEMSGAGFFISGTSIIFSSYYFFRGYFLEEYYDTFTLLRPAIIFLLLSSISFLWGFMEQRYRREEIQR